ncbi:protein of unknown function [Chitinophaga eiseniae]|uniref:DUF4296 domain-containing protein n=1 Tax=Chitinophaga eiseniae TaxID=634771 RepID=A0A1T4QAW3_9BACT|nr:DUF4296 domain-containing protein [Chitinophaga eiseniae]SKA00835.1 protein of unknown function [Chitinophaga eiseniae]
MNNRFKALVTGFIFLMAACGDPGNVPKEYIQKNKMSKILVDMTLADAYGNEVSALTAGAVTDSVRQENVKIYYKQILDLHQVSVKDFMASYNWYESHPDRMKDVFEKVQADIANRKNKLGNPVEENAPVKFRMKSFFPNADKAFLLPASDTVRPFIKRQP